MSSTPTDPLVARVAAVLAHQHGLTPGHSMTGDYAHLQSDAEEIVAAIRPNPNTTWRTGRKVGATLYLQTGDAPSDADQLIGMLVTPQLAHHAVSAVNTLRELRAAHHNHNGACPTCTTPWPCRTARTLQEPR